MELAGESGRVDTTMSVSRVPSPTEMACQVAENWCYTQVMFTCIDCIGECVMRRQLNE